MNKVGSVVLMTLLLHAGCDARQLGLPRVGLELVSPGGELVAQVRNSPSLDPPRQSLWVGPSGGKVERVAELAEDQEWCDRIVWSADGSMVGFLVAGTRLIVVDIREGGVLTERALLREAEHAAGQRVVDGKFSPVAAFDYLVQSEGSDDLDQRSVALR